MDTTTPQTPGTQSQEKVAAGLGAILFFIPLLMDVKTPFVVKYMKQGFLLNVIELALAIITSFVWMLSPIAGICHLVLFVVTVILALNAFQGKDYSIKVILENAEKLIQTLGVQAWFTTK